MKLSEKGKAKIAKLADRFFWETRPSDVSKALQDLVESVEPDDFKGVVCLTVEEAEQIKTFLNDAIELHDKGVVVIQSKGFETIQLINERIKQSEKSYEVK